MMESEANEHCSKTEQQKRARLDRRNAKDRARRSSKSAEQRRSRLDKRNERDRAYRLYEKRACNSKVS